jgi:hypothetical protein
MKSFIRVGLSLIFIVIVSGSGIIPSFVEHLCAMREDSLEGMQATDGHAQALVAALETLTEDRIINQDRMTGLRVGAEDNTLARHLLRRHAAVGGGRLGNPDPDEENPPTLVGINGDTPEAADRTIRQIVLTALGQIERGATIEVEADIRATRYIIFFDRQALRETRAIHAYRYYDTGYQRERLIGIEIYVQDGRVTTVCTESRDHRFCAGRILSGTI